MCRRSRKESVEDQDKGIEDQDKKGTDKLPNDIAVMQKAMQKAGKIVESTYKKIKNLKKEEGIDYIYKK